ncbi:MAG: SpoVG family protein [Clostridia bacterium]
MEYDVNIYPSRGDGAQKASATVNINGGFAIRGVKIMEGSKGLFVSMPSYKAGNGEYKDICFPCTKASKAEFDKALLTAYQQKMAQSQTAAAEPAAPAQQEQSQPVMAEM